MKFKKKLLATLVAMALSPVAIAQNIGFEDGNTGSWTGNGISAVGSQTLQAGSNTWTVNPYGSYMGKLTITSGTFSQMTSALSLTSASASGIQSTLTTQAQTTGNGQGNPTTASWASKTVTLTAGQNFSLAWQYISTDYVPFNDGSIATLVKVGSPSTTAVLNNYTSQYALLGFTNPGTGDYSTGSYGSTGWQTATYSVTETGDYLLGFGVFNLDDQALSPVLYVDEVIGTTSKNGQAFGAVAPNPGTSAPDTSSGSVTPPAVTIVGTTTTNGTSSFSDSTGGSVVTTSALIANDYLTRTFTNVTNTSVGRLTTTPTTVITTYSDNSTTSAAGSPITVSENYSNIIDITHNDVATSFTPNAAARTHVDTGSVVAVDPLVTPTDNFMLRYGSMSVSGLISRTSTTPTLFVYDRSTTTVTTNDFSPSSIYTDTTSTVNTTSTVSETYNLVNTENFTRTVTRVVNDVASSVTPDAAARTHIDSGLLTLELDTPVTPNANYSIRTGTASATGFNTRISTTPTLFVYDRTVSTTTDDNFANTSVYTNTSNTVNTNSTVSSIYNVVNIENFTRTITKDVLDTMTGLEVIGDIQRVSNGIDPTSMSNARTAPATVNNGKSITVTAGGIITANELYTVTTPTRFTYNRVVDTTTADVFAPTSVYTNTSGTTRETSTVTGEYDVVTGDSQGRTAAYDVSVNLRTDQVQTVNKLHGMMNRAIEFGKTIVYKRFDHSNDGYNGHTNLFGVGHNKDLDGGVNLGFGINKLDTMLSGNNSNVRAETVQLGATLSKKDVNGFDLSSTVQHSMTSYNATATPTVTVNTTGDARLLATQPFNRSLANVSGKTSGTDSSIAVRVVGPGDIIRPVLGATAGTRNVKGYNGNIEILPGTTVSNKIGAVNDTYSFGTVGAVAKYDMFNATALYHTDGVKQIGVGLQQEKENLTFNIRADRLQTNQGASNVYSAGLVYKF